MSNKTFICKMGNTEDEMYRTLLKKDGDRIIKQEKQTNQNHIVNEIQKIQSQILKTNKNNFMSQVHIHHSDDIQSSNLDVESGENFNTISQAGKFKPISMTTTMKVNKDSEYLSLAQIQAVALEYLFAKALRYNLIMPKVSSFTLDDNENGFTINDDNIITELRSNNHFSLLEAAQQKLPIHTFEEANHNAITENILSKIIEKMFQTSNSNNIILVHHQYISKILESPQYARLKNSTKEQLFASENNDFTIQVGNTYHPLFFIFDPSSIHIVVNRLESSISHDADGDALRTFSLEISKIIYNGSIDTALYNIPAE